MLTVVVSCLATSGNLLLKMEIIFNERFTKTYHSFLCSSLVPATLSSFKIIVTCPQQLSNRGMPVVFVYHCV